MKEDLIYPLVLVISLLFIYLVGGQVIIIVSLFIIFDKCLLGRVNVIPGIEFVTLSTILVVLVYGWIIGILFCIFVPMIIPSIINIYIGDKWIANKDFAVFAVGIGNIIDIVCVIIIYLLRGLDILWIMIIIIIFKQVMTNMASRLKTTNFVLDTIGIIINILFNISLIYFFHSFWLTLI